MSPGGKIQESKDKWGSSTLVHTSLLCLWIALPAEPPTTKEGKRNSLPCTWLSVVKQEMMQPLCYLMNTAINKESLNGSTHGLARVLQHWGTQAPRRGPRKWFRAAFEPRSNYWDSWGVGGRGNRSGQPVSAEAGWGRPHHGKENWAKHCPMWLVTAEPCRDHHTTALSKPSLLPRSGPAPRLLSEYTEFWQF